MGLLVQLCVLCTVFKKKESLEKVPYHTCVMFNYSTYCW